MSETSHSNESSESPDDLAAIYETRFAGSAAYRNRVWRVLVDRFFQPIIPSDSVVVDLGCGYGEFVNAVNAKTRYGMDLNPDTRNQLAAGVRFLQHDASLPWPLEHDSVDAIFSSNFFEHLPNKEVLQKVFANALDCLRPGGVLIALGPNIRCLNGVYWDFWDHHVALSDRSLNEGLKLAGFQIEKSVPKFLPYTMSDGLKPPIQFLKIYLAFPILWRIFGAQFLVVASKPGRAGGDRLEESGESG